MKHISHYEPIQSFVQKDLTEKIYDLMNKNINYLALSATEQAVLKAHEKLEAVAQLALLAAPASMTYSVLPGIDSVVDTTTLAGSTAYKIACDLQDIEDHNSNLRMLAAQSGYDRSFMPGIDAVVDTTTFACNTGFKMACEYQDIADQNISLGMLAAPASMNYSVMPGIDSIVNTASLAGSAAYKIARDLQDIEDHNSNLRMLAAQSGYDRSLMPGIDSVVDTATFAGSAAFKMACEYQDMVDHNISLGMLAASANKNYKVLHGIDSVVDTATLTCNAGFKMAYDAQQKVMDYNKGLGMLGAPFGYDCSALSRFDSIVDTATLAGDATSPLHFGKQNILSLGIPYECFREEHLLPPVIKLNPSITIDHNWVNNEPKRLLIIKKNCPEEVYNPNKNEMRVRLFKALDTYLEMQSKNIRQKRKQLEFCETEELKLKQEGVIQAHDRLVQWAETIESDYLLLKEEELIRKLQEKPEIIGYLLEGLQTIKRRNNQLRNEPEFIEEQRTRVAYNHNSFELDDGTDHLLNYEVMRWLDRVQSDGITVNHEPEKNENNAHEIAKQQSDATHSTTNTNQKRVPDFKKNRSWTQFVQNKNILEEFEQICDKEGCTTKKQIVDEFWIVYGNELGGKKSGLYDACCNNEKASKFLEQVISEHKKAK